MDVSFEDSTLASHITNLDINYLVRVISKMCVSRFMDIFRGVKAK